MSNTYATWNPLDKTASAALSNGNLTVTPTAAYPTLASLRATIGVSSGKWYWEVTCVGRDIGGYSTYGVATEQYNYNLPNRTGFVGVAPYSWSWCPQQSAKYYLDVREAYGIGKSEGCVLGFSLDMDVGTLALSIDGTNYGIMYSGLTGTVFPAASATTEGYSAAANFGATSFSYPVTSGFSAGLFNVTIEDTPLNNTTGGTQLAGADAGYEDASAYTASSPFLYNASAFGQNIPYSGDRSMEPQTLGQEFAVSKASPYNRAAADVTPNQIRIPLSAIIQDMYAEAGTTRYTRTTDGTNTTSKMSATAGRHGSEAQGTGSAFKTSGLPTWGPGADRVNLKTKAANESDSVVKRRTKVRYVWGTHNVSA